jgi:sRNA-binding carbon storage regulator CsrA
LAVAREGRPRDGFFVLRSEAREAENMRGLIITRRPGESITIDGPATIEVVQRSATRLKLRIEAAKGVRILRSELAPAERMDPTPPDGKINKFLEAANIEAATPIGFGSFRPQAEG